MPRKRAPKLDAWSFSRLNTYETCPLKAKLAFVDKLGVGSNPAMERGSQIHKMAEDMANAKKLPKTFPEELECFDEEFKTVHSMRKSGCEVFTEQKWAFDKDWNPLESFFDHATWCRVVVDLMIVDREKRKAISVDHKTGKIRDEHRDQNKLYACATLSMFQEIEVVECELWYLDQGEIKDDVYKRGDLPELRKYWEKRSKPLLSDRIFAPRPNNLCTWCDFSAAKGGPCKY